MGPNLIELLSREREREIWTPGHTWRMPCDEEGRDGVILLLPRNPETASNQQELGERMGHILPHSLRRNRPS